MLGAVLIGAAWGVPVLLDGLVLDVGALAASDLAPSSAGYVILGDLSPEPCAASAPGSLDLKPLLDLDMRLGEGTGGLLAVPLIGAAARVLGTMATLEELGFG